MTISAPKTKVAAYCRVSTDKDDQLLSLKAQKEFFYDYAQKNNFELVKLYADEGISGTKLKNRWAFQQMMADAEKGLFERVFVKDISRLARNVVDFLQSIRRLKALHIDCQFLTANMSLNDGELTLTILAAVAQEESANLSKRVKFGKKKNAANGKVPNLVYGYDKIPGEYFCLRVNAIEAQVVRTIFHDYGYRDLSMRQIAENLNAAGYRSKKDCSFSQNAISRILRNRLYIGDVINGKEYVDDYLTGHREKADTTDWQIVHKEELAIVQPEVFLAVQEKLYQKAQQMQQLKQRNSNRYLFSNLLYCAHCGSTFRRIQKKKKEGYYVRWACNGRNQYGVDYCANKTFLAEEDLFAALTEYCWHFFPQEAVLLQKVQQEFMQLSQGSVAKLSRPKEQQELAALQKKKEKQLQLFEADIICLEELQYRMRPLEKKIAFWQKVSTENDQIKAQGKNNNIFKEKYCSKKEQLFRMEILNNAFWKKVLDRIEISEEQEVKVVLRSFCEN